MELKTVEGVEIASTGTYPLDTGETTFTADHLKGAVLASTDPTVVAPRLGIGHSDPRFADDLDGEPALGTVQNLRLSDDGQTIIGDFKNVPAWLADSMPSAYPGRSIEGGFNFKAPSGRDYPLVISQVKLLGQTWPGITSLADLQETLEANGPVPEPTVASGAWQLAGGRVGQLIHAKIGRTDVNASVDLNAAAQSFATDLSAGKVPKLDDAGPQEKWWARNVQAEGDGSLSFVVDDEAGNILRVPFTVENDALTYGTPELVKASSSMRGATLLASLAKPAARPRTEATMDVSVDALRKRLGLAEDANEDAIQAALGTEAEPKPKIPEGMALVDEATLAQLREGAKAGSEVAAKLARNERDDAITAAIKAGKFPVARRERYVKAWDADPEGTRDLIASLEPGLVPVSAEMGRSGDGEGDPAHEDTVMAGFERQFFPELARDTTGGAA